MREIKFRVWENKVLIGYEWIVEGKWLVQILPSNKWKYGIFNDKHLDRDQFIGFKDKNGKEIYEGDILKMPDAEQAMWVEYQPPEFVMRFKTKSGNKSESWSTFDLVYTENQLVEIIGNIYENPELLK